jgi:hypothetical protein
MVIGDILGPVLDCAPVAQIVPESWLEPLDIFFSAILGACGNQPSVGTRGTSDAVSETVIFGECALIV